MAVTQRSLAEVCNKKAAMIAIQALNNTRKASRASIEASLGQLTTVTRTTKAGKTAKSRRLSLVQAQQVNAPLAALLVNKRRAALGEPGLRGAAMTKGIRKFLSRRFSSIGFLASGWLPAIKALSAVLKERFAVSRDKGVKQYGRRKGGAQSAKDGWNPVATIWNAVQGSGSANAKVNQIISDGVQKALNAEAASMDAYVETKLRKDAASF
jgi:hypothetical protein